VVARNEMGETVMSTPAIVDGRIYLRTEKRLMCFGK
jgi:outer membrane protein assembly factor BamB